MYVIMLALMVPAASGLVDCRQACRSCRENKEVPSMVEVYCSMCEECKERKRDKFAATSTTLHGETILPQQVKYEEFPPSTEEPYLFGPTSDSIIKKLREKFATAEKEHPIMGHQRGAAESTSLSDEDRRHGGRQRRRRRQKLRNREHHDDVEYVSSVEDYHRLRPEDIPEGCPTPPVCSDEEEVLTVKPVTTTTTTTTTTAPTTTRRPCPPIRPCRKKKKKRRPSCYMPCMPMCPCPVVCPPQQCGQNICPGQQCGQSACPPVEQQCISHGTTARTASIQTITHSAEHLTHKPDPTVSNEFMYMYIGVPKHAIKFK